MAYSPRLWLMAIGWWNKINQCRKLKLNLTQTWGLRACVPVKSSTYLVCMVSFRFPAESAQKIWPTPMRSYTDRRTGAILCRSKFTNQACAANHATCKAVARMDRVGQNHIYTVCTPVFFLRIWEKLGFMSPPNLAIWEIGFSCRYYFATPARREAFGLPANGVCN